MACGDDAGSGAGGEGGTSDTAASTSSQQASSSTGRPLESQLNFRCSSTGTVVRCSEPQFTRRRVAPNHVLFECVADNGHGFANMDAPGEGNASALPGALYRITATCGATQEIVVDAKLGDTIDVSVFEPGVYIEGTFGDAAGKVQGYFAVHDGGD